MPNICIPLIVRFTEQFYEYRGQSGGLDIQEIGIIWLGPDSNCLKLEVHPDTNYLMGSDLVSIVNILSFSLM